MKKKTSRKRSLKKKIKSFTKRWRPLLVISTIALFIGIATFFISLFVRGYRPDLKSKTIFPTGLLAANSIPKGALVYINNKLVTVTDDTINLTPGKYNIRLLKDGYFPWEKKITIKKEVVYQTNAYLFRTAPDLKPLTTTGAINPALSPDGLRIVYSVASASAHSKNGVWVSELNSNGFPIRSSTSKQLTRNTATIDWSKAKFIWSPKGEKILALFGSLDSPTAAYLLSPEEFTPSDQLRDVGFQLPSLLNQWLEERNKNLQEKIAKLPPQWQEIATQSAALITFSPHRKKFFYLATQETTLPDNLLPHPPARSTQPEERNIKPGRIYVYDLKEDTNFFIIEGEKIGLDWKKFVSSKNQESQPTLKDQLEKYLATTQFPLYWLATNSHLIFIENNQIKVVETDGTNKQTLFAGSFINGYVFPSPDGTSLIVLTSMHPHLPPNLYQVKIR